ncbi:hypothetical protein [Nonomuraea guangzhouensis]|uniref:Uncharacterized protein n=1 Tax=Nonomuraea guangzhouensis TaxID=1291555 RepID=A0ABW4G7W5_9ACTN|nr:hypothetical protein [Nonomuraea guangzhouensis]
MTAVPPLLVPIDVKALLVNDLVRQRGFQRWQMDYQNLPTYTSPQPPPFSGTDTSWPTDPSHNGIYLHWTLPATLRRGDHDTATGTTTFPYVPNRWLVVRYSGPDPQARVATGWVIESDYVDVNDGTSPYLDPTASTPTPTLLGRCLPLSGWSEPGSDQPFLTAVAPGNITFASYQPYVANVFSMHDPLTDVTDGEVLSYLVAGWYSQPSADVLASYPGEGDFAQWLDTTLGWTVSTDDTATASFYHGMVHGLPWSTTDPANPPNMPADTTPRLAVGSTSIDALTAMIKQQAQEDNSDIDAELLEAFQYDFLRLLDEQDGQQVLEQRIHQAWFGEHPSGSTWEVVRTPTHDSTEALRHQAEAARAPSWLPALNTAQTAYDSAVRELADLHRQLYETWWKSGKAATLPKYPDGVTPALFAQALDPTTQTSLAATVQNKLHQIQALQAQIPWGATPDDLQASITAYATAHDLPTDRQLKRIEQPPLWSANDPVVVISATGSASIATDPTTLACRLADQTVTGITYDGTPIHIADIGTGLPSLDLTGTPQVIQALIDEFFFLDPDNATLVAAHALGTTDPAVIAALNETMAGYQADIGTVPAIQPGPWTQPWSPLWLLWQVTYYPIAYGSTDTPNWTFDGTQYTWTGNGADTDNLLQLSGQIFLTPQATFNMKARLDQYLSTNPDADLTAVEDFVTSVDDWDFLSQSLTGFGASLTCRDPSSLWLPSDGTTLAQLATPGATAMPMPGPATQPPFQAWPPSGFQPLRSGQFAFLRVMVVDRFGQSLEIVNSTTAEQFTPIIADGMIPDDTVLQQEPYRFVQLTPRLLQPGQVSLDFVSATDDTHPLDPDLHNPLCGWLLPNHLDRAISCYGPTGPALGDIRVVVDDTATRVVDWSPAPGSPYPTIASLSPAYPHLAAVLTGVQAGGPAAFAEFLHTIDTTLWSIDPAGARDDQFLSVLIGRPLALIRTRVALELDTTALTDPSWRFTFTPQPSDLPGYGFDIRLGDLTMRQDGLIGYFTGTDYTRFDSVAPPPTDSSYVHQIGPGNFLTLCFDPASTAYLTMLVDPRAAIHATTDLLPVTSLTLPQHYVKSALSAMAVTFRAGPLPTDLVVPATGDGTQIVLPTPASKNGTWSWIETGTNGSPTTYGVTPADQAATLPTDPPTLRTGWLQLTTDLSSEPEETT